jgi:hypothetical protein
LISAKIMGRVTPYLLPAHRNELGRDGRRTAFLMTFFASPVEFPVGFTSSKQRLRDLNVDWAALLFWQIHCCLDRRTLHRSHGIFTSSGSSIQPRIAAAATSDASTGNRQGQ